ncbi:DUF2878 domain-containing protein [Desulfobulbus propionicus]
MSGHAWTTVINTALFECGWLVCVLGAAAGFPWSATLAGMALVLVHLALVRHPGREIVLLGASGLLGALVDALHIGTGVLSFPLGSLHPAVPPPWILVLWLQFAMTLHYALAWLAGRYLLGAALGGLAGALAYWAGVRLGAALFGPDLLRCLVQIGASWCAVMVGLLWLAARTGGDDGRRTYRLFAEQQGVRNGL